MDPYVPLPFLWERSSKSEGEGFWFLARATSYQRSLGSVIGDNQFSLASVQSRDLQELQVNISLHRTALVMAILPIIRFQLIQERIPQAVNLSQHIDWQVSLYSSTPTSFLISDKNRSDGIRAVNSAWQILLRDEYNRKSPEQYNRKSAEQILVHFLGFVEGKLGIEIPGEFEDNFVNSGMDKTGRFPPTLNPSPRSGDRRVLKLTDEYSLVIDPSETLRPGNMTLMNEKSEPVWSTRLWATSRAAFGRSENSTCSIEAVLSHDAKSVFVFSSHIGAFMIVQYDLKTGKHLGNFVTIWPKE